MPTILHNAFRLQCDFSVVDAILNAILWFVLTIVTLGLAAFLFPFYLPKVVLNKTQVIDLDGNRVGQMVCDISLRSVIVSALIWWLLTIVTFGLAYFVYIYRVYRIILNETRLQFD
ncbi:hypothetical protein PSA7680_01550 [Pseudoruegeria aquimaris]|uniref:Inner membrane protein YjgN n=1 Tax=Pseudoruegeria aquimaris TaxID=393663 RepID=A0A1Y5S7T8_9RHOB|nr:DUF6693 family protein [Pseudoruegeria aquimaris]SLN33068.1 hypothetical protein PSA7680_01550 [Pseudoruegeria aquimaris]